MLVFAKSCDDHDVPSRRTSCPRPAFSALSLHRLDGFISPRPVWRGVQFDPSAFVASTRSLVPLERLRDDLQEHLRDRKQVHGRRRFFFVPRLGCYLRILCLLRFVSSLPFRQKLRLQQQQTCVRFFFLLFFFQVAAGAERNPHSQTFFLVNVDRTWDRSCTTSSTGITPTSSWCPPSSAAWGARFPTFGSRCLGRRSLNRHRSPGRRVVPQLAGELSPVLASTDRQQ